MLSVVSDIISKTTIVSLDRHLHEINSYVENISSQSLLSGVFEVEDPRNGVKRSCVLRAIRNLQIIHEKDPGFVQKS
jgi:hypothetical protein